MHLRSFEKKPNIVEGHGMKVQEITGMISLLILVMITSLSTPSYHTELTFLLIKTGIG